MGKLAVVMMFGFILSFMLYVGSETSVGSNLCPESTPPTESCHLFAPNFIEFVDAFNDPSKSLVDAIINTVLSPEVLIGGAVTGIVAALTGFGLTFIIPAIMIGAVANFLLFPTSVLNSLGLPIEINWLLISMMQIMLVIGYLAFIGGREP